ncbi:prepilin-type N-terminal cleavage/methylation domain-containing protein [Candidatus Nomurabacteria bacterium]|nr:prepilin-type N-terminal cleavage/methylation domain-containing protein [Candidatus Nomurabacteria bacterium]
MKSRDARYASVLRTSRLSTAGFTIIELLVVIFIFGVISSLVIFNYGSFQSDVSVENLAQDVALSIRRAQVYSVSTKSSEVSSVTTFPSYGIHFYLPSAPGGAAILGNERAFIFFADIPPIITPVMYDTNGNCGALVSGDECVEIINITSSDKIVDICYDGVCPVGSKSVDIVFTRPDTEAQLCFRYGISGSCIGNPSYVTIKLESINGRQRLINVWNTGQINVE